MHGLEEAKLDGAALKRNQTSDEGDVCHDVLFENLGQPYILSSNPVKSARASDFEREIGLILKRFTFFFFFFIHLVSFVVFVVRSPTKVEQKSSYKNLFYSVKLLILYPVRPGKNIRRNSRGDIFTRETKKKDTFPFLSRWKGNASFSRAREKRVAVRDSEKVKLDPRARFLSVSFPFYRESKEYPFRNGTLESQTFFRRRPLAK